MLSGIPPVAEVDAQILAANMQDARSRTHELIADLNDQQLIGPKLDIVNPMLWEIGHVGWFHENFILQRAYGQTPLNDAAQSLYDSIAIHHHERWDLPLLSRKATLAYMQQVLDGLLERLGTGRASALDSYLYQFTTFHEDMHGEAFTWARQTLAYPAPQLALNGTSHADANVVSGAGALPGDVRVPGGEFLLGAPGHAPFVFDNEKWCHRVVLEPFSIARAPVTNAEFAEFVIDGGYEQREFWTDAGWQWREQHEVLHPVYWQLAAPDQFTSRVFEQTAELPAHRPVMHVNWFEASAWCRWAGRRLPREAEWEAAALGAANVAGDALDEGKRRYPWGNETPKANHANLDGRVIGCVDVAALPDSDSAFGCRQMIGNVWEWCEDVFTPYPGFTPDMYKEYSQTLFGNTRVLRGGAWTTRSRMISGLYRNYFGADRRDVFAGFRTCAL